MRSQDTLTHVARPAAHTPSQSIHTLNGPPALGGVKRRPYPRSKPASGALVQLLTSLVQMLRCCADPNGLGPSKPQRSRRFKVRRCSSVPFSWSFRIGTYPAECPDSNSVVPKLVRPLASRRRRPIVTCRFTAHGSTPYRATFVNPKRRPETLLDPDARLWAPQASARAPDVALSKHGKSPTFFDPRSQGAGSGERACTSLEIA